MTWPAPWQVGHTRGVVPLRAPVPEQTPHGASVVSRSGSVTPSSASSNDSVTRALDVGAAAGTAAAAAAAVEDPAEHVAEAAARASLTAGVDPAEQVDEVERPPP